MPRVLLINPPQKYFGSSRMFNVYFPIGLLYVGAMIKKICDVKILDCLVTDFEILKKKEYTLYGTSFKRIKEIIKNENPDIVGISIPFSAQSEQAIKISRICKEVNPKIIVIFGGPDASVRYDMLLKEKTCDFCVVGEGEETFFEVVKKFSSKQNLYNIEGLAYKKDKKIQYKARPFIKNLDSLPLPAYDLININDYLKNKYLYATRGDLGKKSISIITSRGCPFNCVFCSIKLHMGNGWRANSPDYVINHLKLCINKLGIRNFHFEDDNFSLDRKRFEAILDKIIENKLNIKWDVPNGLRADSLDYNLLKKMKKSGCKMIKIAIESGNQYVLDKIIKKNLSLKKVLEVVKDCKKLKIVLIAFYVVGLPGETLDNIKETLNLAIKLLREYDCYPYVSVATPLYGTELYNICVKNKIIKKMNDKDFATATQIDGNHPISTKEFSKDDLDKALKEYKSELKKEMVKYFLRHPGIALDKLIHKSLVLGDFFKLIKK
ncbi:B12 binding domain protein [Candidatus Tiddalikarchaeum anstoanum]|nr:B12 binding domain protein [Candidatus Tiddalikarchaeum anstoanum]